MVPQRAISETPEASFGKQNFRSQSWFGGFGGEVASQIQELAFDYLDAPVKRLGAAHAPVPFSEPLEFASFPSVETISQGVRDLLQGI